MPVVVSIVVVSLLWRFNDDGNSGLLTNLRGFLSFGAIPAVNWLGNANTALGSITAMSVWQAVGFHMVIWLSGLHPISPTLSEAGANEAASWIQNSTRIVMPLSGPVLATAAILRFLAMDNQSLWPLMEVQEAGYRPVMVGLQYFLQLNRAWGIGFIGSPRCIFWRLLSAQCRETGSPC